VGCGVWGVGTRDSGLGTRDSGLGNRDRCVVPPTLRAGRAPEGAGAGCWVLGAGLAPCGVRNTSRRGPPDHKMRGGTDPSLTRRTHTTSFRRQAPPPGSSNETAAPHHPFHACRTLVPRAAQLPTPNSQLPTPEQKVRDRRIDGSKDEIPSSPTPSIRVAQSRMLVRQGVTSVDSDPTPAPLRPPHGVFAFASAFASLPVLVRS
jgi:hypothetical protein